MRLAPAQSVDFVRSAVRDLRYPLPQLRVTRAQEHEPTVYFCAPDYDVPSGGIRVVYRHVDILNAAGIDAAVLHRRSGFRCTWFENATRVVGSGGVRIGPDDLVVVSELAIRVLGRLPAGYRFVVFNQNPFLTWQRVSYEEVARYAGSPDLAAILTVSGHSQEMLSHAAPDADVRRLHNSIDPGTFHPGTDRERTIVYMPRGSHDAVRQVLGILSGRGVLDGWEVIAVDGVSEKQVASRLRSATMFLSFAHSEGFGLPAAEAMASGAYVVGMHGFAGREYFRPEFSTAIEPGDVLGMAQAIEWVIDRESTQPGWCSSRGALAAAYIAEAYSPERERRDVVDTYADLVARATAPAARAATGSLAPHS